MIVCYTFAMLIGLWVGSIVGNGAGTAMVGVFAVLLAVTLFLIKKWKIKKDAEIAALRKACFD